MAPSPDQAIAMFDSGVGGLTVLHECLVSLPEEDYVYLGDDARFPYGARSEEQLQQHTEQVSRFLPARIWSPFTWRPRCVWRPFV